MIKPNPFYLFLISVVFGGAFAAMFIWLFGIKISSLERFSAFPEKWTILELVWNATAGIILIGAIRAIYVSLRGHFYGSSIEKPTNSGEG